MLDFEPWTSSYFSLKGEYIVTRLLDQTKKNIIKKIKICLELYILLLF